MKTVLSIATIVFAMISSVSAQYDEAAKAILDEMSKKYKEMPAFTAEFKYILENPAEDLTETFEGKVTVKDDMYRLDMEGQEIINNGETVWTYLPELNEVNISEYSAEDQDISLNNIFTLYEKGYKYLYIESINGGKTDVVDLVPEDINNTYFKIRLLIDTNSRALESFKIFDKNGNRYVYEINEFEEDASIGADYFMFDASLHEGVEVIDFR